LTRIVRTSTPAWPFKTSGSAALTRWAPWLVAGAYLAAHLPLLAPSLEDIDSINFALGLRDFSVADHQPHPPGYPVYIALGRASLAVISTLMPALSQTTAEAKALAVWSALGGAVALVAAAHFFRSVDESGPGHTRTPPVVWLLAAAPLFWTTGLRPMSDMTGLALALVAQALLVSAVFRPRARLGLEPRMPESPRSGFLIWGALVAGVAAGVRVQTALLTVPVLLWAGFRARHASADRGSRLSWEWLVSRPGAALMAGGLAWAVPLMLVSGGVWPYLAALGTQAGEDLAYVDMLWANPTPRRLAFALYETFVLPWASIPLTVVVGLAAAVGAIALLRRNRQALWVAALGYLPYAASHLLAQETFHTRYALPLVPVVAWLAVHGASAVSGRYAPASVAALTTAAFAVALPPSLAYAREAHPAFRAIDAMSRTAEGHERPVLVQHFAMRRALQASPPTNTRVIDPRRNFEWLGAVSYWKDGGLAPVWLLADPRRTDPALIDRYSRLNMTPFRWAVADRPEFGGARPTGADWYRFERPGWFAGEGWSLTPETAGLARASGTGIDHGPIEAYVLRRAEPMHLVVGGRHMFGPVAGVGLTVALDDVPVAEWSFAPAHAGDSFLRFIELPDGILPGDGPYARLTIAARPENAQAAPVVAIVQFDVQPAGRLVYGFAEGWHEDEFDPPTGRRWRWTSERARLRVEPARPFTLRLKGESPIRYVKEAPHVRITAGARTVAELSPSDDFEWRVPISAQDVMDGGGGVAIETDRVYAPGTAEGTSDSRRLGLRLFEIDVQADAPTP
jgi:hypothetical protein